MNKKVEITTTRIVIVVWIVVIALADTGCKCLGQQF